MESSGNRDAVWNFFRDNPCHSRIDCAAELGLSRQTINKHASAIRDGWRPASSVLGFDISEVSDAYICIAIQMLAGLDCDLAIKLAYVTEAERRGLELPDG